MGSPGSTHSSLSAVAVGVEDRRRPALRDNVVTGLVKLVGLQPAHHVAATAGPQRVVLVIGKLQVMGSEAGLDGDVFLGFLIVERKVAIDARGGKVLRGRMVGAFTAEIRRLRPADPRRVPDSPVLVQHGIVGVGLAVPDPFLAPVGRGHADGIAVGGGRLRIQHQRAESRVGIVYRVEYRKVVGAQLGSSENPSIAVDRRVPPIGGRKVVQVGLRIGPVPHGRDHVAFDSLGSFGYPGRRFAGGNAVGPSRPGT